MASIIAQGAERKTRDEERRKQCKASIKQEMAASSKSMYTVNKKNVYQVHKFAVQKQTIKAARNTQNNKT